MNIFPVKIGVSLKNTLTDDEIKIKLICNPVECSIT